MEPKMANLPEKERRLKELESSLPTTIDDAEIERMRRQLVSLRQAYESIVKAGLSREILIAYVRDKTGVSKKDIHAILESQDDFYKKLAKLG